MAFWYHYAILFEALFILTTVDAGTRVGRFMIQEIAGLIHKPLQETNSWAGNLLATAICVFLWGYFLYQGAVDPLGGINTLWPLFGIANQMLAAIALMLATVVVVKLKRERYVWVPGIPALWLIICTMTAGYQKLVGPISFTAAANKYSRRDAAGPVAGPGQDHRRHAADRHQQLRRHGAHRPVHGADRGDGAVLPACPGQGLADQPSDRARRAVRGAEQRRRLRRTR